MPAIRRHPPMNTGQRHGTQVATACHPAGAADSGFTLIEMLVVMGIIILAVTLAIPTIRALTGSKSQSVAQNTVAAFLARTRAEAIGLQQPEGLLFYIDPATARVGVAQVEVTPTQTGDPPGVALLDLVPDRDQMLLPPGLGLRTLKDQPITGATDPYPRYRYLGFNFNSTAPTLVSYNNNTTGLGGVILFDSNGRVTPTQYGFRFVSGGNLTGIGQLAFGSSGSLPGNWPTVNSTYLRSQIAFVLYDRDVFRNYQQSLGVTPNDGNSTAQQAKQDAWMDTNTTPLLINRYNGSITAAE